MIKKKEIFKKSLSSWIIFSVLFALITPQKTYAADIDIDALINKYNATTAATTNVINSADNNPSSSTSKQQSPKVDVKFMIDGSLKAGSKITARAVPSYFNNTADPKELYFTWYLKKSGCDLTDSKHPSGTEENDKGDIVLIKEDNDKSKISSCDMDDDNIITVNDWKIEAARIAVSSGYDYQEADYSKSIDNKVAAFKATPEINEDNWRKGFLRNGNGDIYQENNDDADNCYVQSPDSGYMYELRKVNSDFTNSCPSGYRRSCVSDQEIKCPIYNTAYDPAAAQAAALAIPPQTYDVPKSIIDPVKSVFTACATSSEESNDFCAIKDIKNFESGVSCGKGYYSICMDSTTHADANFSDGANVIGTIFGKKDDTDKMCSSVAAKDTANSDALNKLFLPNDNAIYSSPNTKYTDNSQKCSTLQSGIINGTKDSFGKTIIAGNADLAPKCNFQKAENLCKHLFPVLPKDVTKSNGNQAVSGDGEFNNQEKHFWHADPTKASTIEGAVDEQKVIGLGMDKFEWLYGSGDQLGVVVEGDSVFSTEHADAKHKRMWAFSAGKCSALNDIGDASDKNRGFYLEGDGQVKQGFLTTDVDLNDCLEENLLKPDNDGLHSLKLELISNPENPINDPEGDGDTLNIESSSLNTEDPSGLLYQWSVQKSKTGSLPITENTSWSDITNKLIEGGSFTDADRQGLFKSKLSIKLNIKDIEDGMLANSFTGVFYLKIKLKVKGSNADGNQDAEGYINVRIKQQQNKIVAYPVTADSSGMLSLNKGLNDQSTEICSDIDEQSGRCYVSKNQIVGLEVKNTEGNKLSNFYWKVNGENMSCSKSVSSSCEEGGNKLFLPILGNEGEAIDVVVTALNQNKESIEISKRFVITASELRILSAEANIPCSSDCLASNNLCPKYLGKYVKLNGSEFPDCYYNVWVTKEGSDITLQANGQSGFEWTVDGQHLLNFDDKNQIQINVDKNAGDNYNVSLLTRDLSTTIAQKNNLRRALYKNWGISPDESIDELKSASIQINVEAGSPQALTSASSKSLAASLITHLPQQLIFLFKIFLTSATLLLSMSVLFAFMPEAGYKKED